MSEDKLKKALADLDEKSRDVNDLRRIAIEKSKRSAKAEAEIMHSSKESFKKETEEAEKEDFKNRTLKIVGFFLLCLIIAFSLTPQMKYKVMEFIVILVLCAGTVAAKKR